MRTFFYFVPGRDSLRVADLAALGLAYAFERGIDCRPAMGVLGGQNGVVFAQQDSYAEGQLGYYADRQVWKQAPGSALWVGHYKEQLPGPEDLARKKQLDGHWLELDDGQQWLVPVARSYSERATGKEMDIVWTLQLPQRLDLAADGRWVTGAVVNRYAALWELAEAWLRVRTGEATDTDRARYDAQGEKDAAVLALQANYRLGRVEAALLGLLNDNLVGDVLDQLIDLPNYIRLVKKKAALIRSQSENSESSTPAGCGSSAGLAGEILTTDPALPTLTT
jgi:hypothetical protein